MSVTLNFKPEALLTYNRIMWDFRNADFEGYRLALTKVNWDGLLDSGMDVDHM